MKKVILVLIIVGSINPLFSASWSGTVDGNVAVTGETDDLALDTTDRFTFQTFIPFGIQVPMAITAEAYYEFAYSNPLKGGSESMAHIVDIPVLNFTAQFPLQDTSTLTLDVGRFNVYDVTALILSQPIDGSRIAFTGESYELSTHIGFTGFLNAYDVAMFGVVNTNILSDVYTLAPAFALANVTFRLPYLFDAQHTFSAELHGAVDVTGNITTSNRFYGTLGLQGPLGESFYYNASSTLSYVILTENVLGNMSILELSAFLPFANSILTWKTVFATGGIENNFIPITEILANMDSSIPYGGIVKSGLIAVLHPVDSLFFLVESDVLFNVMDDVRDKGYLGVQWNVSSRWDIASDVQLVGSVGNFFSSDPAQKPYLDASVALSVTF